MSAAGPGTVLSPQQALLRYLESLLRSDSGDPPDVGDSRDKPRDAAADDSRIGFDCILFECAETVMALPVGAIRGIVEFRPEEVSDPGEDDPEWVIGRARHGDREIALVDTAGLLLGRTTDPQGARSASGSRDDPPRRCILVATADHGLLCETIREWIPVRVADVRWRRGGASTRPWFNGILEVKRCALLDPEAVIRQLQAPPGGG